MPFTDLLMNPKTVELCVFLFVLVAGGSSAQIHERVVDIPTRPEATQRFLSLASSEPRAAVIFFAGSHNGLMITPRALSDGGRAISWCVPVICLLRRV